MIEDVEENSVWDLRGSKIRRNTGSGAKTVEDII
jgi:hypothetical protein